MQQQDITIDSLRFHFRVSGQGQDLVLMHGWGCSISIWERLEGFLSQWFRVWTVDFPGFGLSEAPREPWSVYDYADNFARFCEAEGIRNPVLVGHSFGGRVAILHASHHTVGKLILIDAAGVKPSHGVGYYCKVYSYKLLKRVLPVVVGRARAEQILEKRRRKSGSDDYNALSGVMRATFVKIVNEDLCRYMPQIKAPTLLLWGECDTATPVADAKRMESLIADAGLVVFDGVGHFSFLEEPLRTERIIENFLDKEKTL